MATPSVASGSWPKLELVYFPMRARGDVIRRILIEAGIPFSETRIAWDDAWPARKLEFQFGQLPVLRVDAGRLVIAQSHAIARYAARLADPELLGAGGTTEAAAEVDMWYHQAEDVFAEFIPPFYLAPDTVDQALADKWSGWMAPFERALGSRDFLAGGGGRISLADYHFLDVLDMAFAYDSDGRLGLRRAAPAVAAYHEKLSQRPGLRQFAEYVKDVRFTISGRI